MCADGPNRVEPVVTVSADAASLLIFASLGVGTGVISIINRVDFAAFNARMLRTVPNAFGKTAAEHLAKRGTPSSITIVGVGAIAIGTLAAVGSALRVSFPVEPGAVAGGIALGVIEVGAGLLFLSLAVLARRRASSRRARRTRRIWAWSAGFLSDSRITHRRIGRRARQRDPFTALAN